MAEEQEGQGLALEPWDWERLLVSLSYMQARYSRGFLRCKPEKWFPGFGMHWLPLAHSLGLELELVETRPVLEAPRNAAYALAGSVDDEPLGLFVDETSARLLSEAVVPGCDAITRDLVLEFLGRRLISSVALCWSGPESSLVQFEPELNPAAMRGVGVVHLVGTVNGEEFTVSCFLGKIMVERLDGLWRRQLRASSRAGEKVQRGWLEVAHLTVPPALLSDYLKSGVSIDLETTVADSMTILVGAKPYLPAQLLNIEGSLGFAVLGRPSIPKPEPEGTVRLSVVLGEIKFDPGLMPELAQEGAVFDTELNLSDQAQLVVNGEKVGTVVLQSYQGRFAMSVL